MVSGNVANPNSTLNAKLQECYHVQRGHQLLFPGKRLGKGFVAVARQQRESLRMDSGESVCTGSAARSYNSNLVVVLTIPVAVVAGCCRHHLRLRLRRCCRHPSRDGGSGSGDGKERVTSEVF